MATGTPSAERFIEALRSLEDRDDLDAMASLYDEASETSNPSDREPHRGRDGARRFWRAYRDSFSRIHSEFRSVVEADGVAMLEWTSTGTLATGSDVRYDGVSVVEFGDRGVRRFRAYFDPHDLAAGASGDGG